MAVTVQELINNPKYQDQKCLVLLNKPTVDGPNRPNKYRNQKPPKYFRDFTKKQEKFNKQVLAFIKTQTKFNEFVLQQFKAHNWTK